LRNASAKSSVSIGGLIEYTICTMTALPKTHMTVDEYLTWAEERPGRYELLDGSVFAMSPEGAGHAEKKAAVHATLLAGIRARGLPCYVLPDGMTVRINDVTAYEPDALVYCGAKIAPSAIEVPNPIIVVEVLSPSTRHIDLSAKLADYFRLPSIMHYLIVDPAKPRIVHHARAAGDTILTRIVSEGHIVLDPPGLEFAMADIYSA
jgi:Uma2 family endonuclease